MVSSLETVKQCSNMKTSLDLTDVHIGPIVRVNPEELSIHDPAVYGEIYVGGSKRRTENYNHFCKGIDFDGELMCLFRKPEH